MFRFSTLRCDTGFACNVFDRFADSLRRQCSSCRSHICYSFTCMNLEAIALIFPADKSQRSISATPSNSEGHQTPLVPLRYGPHEMKVLCPYCHGQVTTSVEYSAGRWQIMRLTCSYELPREHQFGNVSITFKLLDLHQVSSAS